MRQSQCQAQASLPVPEASRQFGFLLARLLVSEHLEDKVEACDVLRSSLGSHPTAEIRQEHCVQGRKWLCLVVPPLRRQSSRVVAVRRCCRLQVGLQQDGVEFPLT